MARYSYYDNEHGLQGSDTLPYSVPGQEITSLVKKLDYCYADVTVVDTDHVNIKLYNNSTRPQTVTIRYWTDPNQWIPWTVQLESNSIKELTRTIRTEG